MSNNVKTEVNIIKLRIESLTANRNFFTVLFTIESAILAIAIRYFACLSAEFVVSAVILFSSISLVLFGVFSLTDSIHFYSKYLEYQYVWKDKVPGLLMGARPKTRRQQRISRERLSQMTSDITS